MQDLNFNRRHHCLKLPTTPACLGLQSRVKTFAFLSSVSVCGCSWHKSTLQSDWLREPEHKVKSSLLFHSSNLQCLSDIFLIRRTYISTSG